MQKKTKEKKIFLHDFADKKLLKIWFFFIIVFKKEFQKIQKNFFTCRYIVFSESIPIFILHCRAEHRVAFWKKHCLPWLWQAKPFFKKFFKGGRSGSKKINCFSALQMYKCLYFSVQSSSLWQSGQFIHVHSFALHHVWIKAKKWCSLLCG